MAAWRLILGTWSTPSSRLRESEAPRAAPAGHQEPIWLRGQIALYDMTGFGLSEVPNASAALPPSGAPPARQRRNRCARGDAPPWSRSGARRPSAAGSPRRVAVGLDGARLALLQPCWRAGAAARHARDLCVLHGGLEVTEPARTAIVAAPLLCPRQGVARGLRLLWRNRSLGRSAASQGRLLASKKPPRSGFSNLPASRHGARGGFRCAGSNR